MQNNNLFKKMFEEINKAHYILLVTPTNPNPDALSSSLSLSNYFYETKVKHKIFNISTVLPQNLNFLSKYEKITNKTPKYYDLIIYLDCVDQECVGEEFKKDIKTISIDHHRSNNKFADINIVDDTKGSTAELLYSYYEINELKISKNNAECLYVGIYDNSLAFTTSRTNQKTFSIISKLLNSNIDVSYITNKFLQRESLSKFKAIAKIMNSLELYSEGRVASVYLDPLWIEETGVRIKECDDIVNTVLNIGIVEIVAYFRVIDNSVRVSLRSKGKIDVSSIATNFYGGGYKNTAELTIPSKDLEYSKEKLISFILDYI